MIRLVIADDESITRRGLAMLDWASEGFEIAGIASNGAEALELVRAQDAEVLLTDIRMPGMDGISLMGELTKEKPALQVIFITAYHQLDYAIEAIKLGACGFVLKPTDKYIGARLTARGQSELAAEVPVDAERVYLKLHSEETGYSLLYSLDGGNWCRIGGGAAKALSPEDFVDKMCFTGVVIGLYASGGGKPCTGAAHFDWFDARVE